MVRHRIRKEEFEALLKEVPEGVRLELLDGEVYEMAPIGSGHAGLVSYLAKALERLYGDRAIVSVQNPILLNPFSLPQPDIALLKPREDFYVQSFPEPKDILLVVEVAYTTKDMDGKKLALYAQAGIPESWLVDGETSLLEVYREPRGGLYRLKRLVEPGEEVAPEGLGAPSLVWRPPRP
jgi:Uma2 family endonuclease